MSDAQLKQRMVIKHRLIIAVLLFVVAFALLYFKYSTDATWSQYQADKRQEANVQSQVDTLTATNNQLLSTIEENGKELVSFSEDKIKYINLASDLSLTHNVRINKLTVSDVWQEGEMSGMTTSIEVEGSLDDVQAFVEEYCGINYTNRINVVSCRPAGRYAWIQRTIDGEKILKWFDLTEDEAMWETMMDEQETEQRQQQAEFGIPAAGDTEQTTSYTYDEATGTFVDSAGNIVSQSVLDETPITLDKMFADTPMKVYLVIDFLGRA